MKNEILSEFIDRFGEYLEMAGEKSPELMNNLLATEIKLLRKEKEYLLKELNNVRARIDY